MATAKKFDLQGWDTANATQFDVLNSSIVAQGRVPKTFAQKGAGANASTHIGGRFGSWKLVAGASGGTLRMDCAIAAGEAFTADQKNYSFNPATAGAVTISNAGARQNLRVAALPAKQPGDTKLDAAFGILGRRAGKLYFEVELEIAAQAGTPANAAMVSIASLDEDKADFGSKSESWSYAQDGNFYFGGKIATANDATCAWGSVNAIVGIAVDLVAGKVWFRKPDGTWIGINADPAKGTGEAFAFTSAKALFPALAVGAGVRMEANFGELPYKNAAPAGFGNWATGTIEPLDGVVAQTEITLTQVAAAGTSNNLMANSTGSNMAPAVVVTALANAKGTQMGIAAQQFALQDWFNAHIADFDNIFHTIDIDTGLSATAPFAWLKPTLYDYAAADIPGTTPPQSVFAILAMTEKRTGNGTLARQVDPTILDGMPADANSVVVISAERFTAKVLMGSVADIFPKSTPTDFALAGNGLIVTNTKEVKWHEITLEDKTKVTPTVPIGGFKMRVDGATIIIEFIGMTFPYPGWTLPGTAVVKIDMTQKLFLTFAKQQLTPAPGQTAKHVLSVSFADPNDPNSNDLPKLDNLKVSTVLDATATQAQQDQMRLDQLAVILSCVTAGLGVLSAGLGWTLKAGCLCAADAASAAAAGSNDVEMGAQSVAEANPNGIYAGFPQPPSANGVYDAVNPNWYLPNGELSAEGIAFRDGQNAVVADNMVANAAGQGGAITRGATCLAIAKGAFAGSLALFVGGVITSAALWGSAYGPGQAKMLANGDIDKVADQFTVENLLDNLLAAYDWPKTSSWELRDARLRDGALVLYGKLT